MRIESIRDLKLEIAVDVFAPIAERLLDRAMSVGRQLGVRPPLQRLCLGIGRGAKRGDFRLAVRMQSQSALVRTLVEQVRAKVGGEIDVAFIGRVKPLAKKAKKAAAKPRAGPAAAVAAPRLTPADLQKIRRPLVIGCSVGHFQTTAGSIGLIARHRKTGRVVLLSNSVPMKTEGSNFIDAAIAVVDDSIQLDTGIIPGIGAVTLTGGEQVLPGQKVRKVGRTSAFTEGEIMVTELDDIAVDYADVGTVVFDDQIEIKGLPNKPFSTDGDSGSLIVNDQNHAIGLLFAGNPFLEDGLGLSFANPLPKVMTALDLVTL
jgi:hypothetical protein